MFLHFCELQSECCYIYGMGLYELLPSLLSLKHIYSFLHYIIIACIITVNSTSERHLVDLIF